MINTLKLTGFLLLLSVFNCGPAKGVAAKDTAETSATTQKVTAAEMIEKGFRKGNIQVSKTQGCPYILNIEEYKDNLDPINIEQFFKGDIPEKVWVKFASLRMNSRCSIARPVSIQEISKREE
ncbi:hypothetical protein [Aquimarina spongiae]|nr:hypothetical protein [Aquimarina spongiae]